MQIFSQFKSLFFIGVSMMYMHFGIKSTQYIYRKYKKAMKILLNTLRKATWQHSVNF